MYGKARLAAIAGCTALIAAVPGTAQARGGCEPGAPEIGDPYVPGYGNGGYDVRHYDLDLAYDPRTAVLDGEATIRATATQSLCRFNLDLVGLDVRRVEVDGRRAAFTRSGRELTITPRRPLRHGRPFEIAVRYDGIPIELGDPEFRRGFMKTEDGVTVAGQPDAAAAWFPVNDHPLDKASYTFDVTVPEGYEVVANGFLRDRDRRHGWTTWEWEARQPMASYLATIDVGFWDVRTWRTERGLPVLDAVDSAITGELRERIDASLSRQGEIVDFLSGAFGPYPFSTVGAIVESQDDFHFALETQTRPVYGKLPWEDDQALGDSIVVHELAHQWFGNHVSLARWQDLWLNEGFASYAEWLWGEREGLGTAQELFEDLYTDPTLDEEFWSVKVADTGTDFFFHPAVYFRGAMTLHVLRNEVGDEDFFAILRTWTATHGGGHGTTPEFMALAERVSGEQLDELFDAWLFTPGKPTLGAPPARARSAPSRWSQQARQRLHIGRF